MSDFAVETRQARNDQYRFAKITALPRTGIRSHAHATLHILFLHNGEFDEAHGEHSHGLKRNGIRISNSNAEHAINFGDAGAAFTVLHINCPSFAGNLTGHMDQSVFLDDDEAVALASAAYGKTANIGTQLKADLDLKRCIARLGLLSNGKNPAAIPRWMEDANHALLDPCAALSVQKMAQSLKVSREHLTRSFRKYFGYTPQEVITANALERAVDLLQTTDASCAEIAIDAGFYDQSHLTGKMAERLGVTPGRLRGMTVA